MDTTPQAPSSPAADPAADPSPEPSQAQAAATPSSADPKVPPAAPPKKQSWPRIILGQVVSILLLLLAVFSIRWSLADHYEVPTGSMKPTVAINDRILVNKVAYSVRIPFTGVSLWDFDGPARGDVVVLESPESDITLLKRVVALPNEKVEVRGGHLYINDREMLIEGEGENLTETLDAVHHRVRLTQFGGPPYGPLTLPADHFLVMGDNRGESRDGRTFGTIHRDKIFGKAFGVYWRDGSFTWEDL
jgi:signal peptidase I